MTVAPISTSRSRALAALAIPVGFALCLLCGLAGSDLLCLTPVLLFTVTLLLRRYPGERVLVARRSSPPRRRVRHRACLLTPPHPAARIPRGGLLIAFALAVRPPPPALSAS